MSVRSLCDRLVDLIVDAVNDEVILDNLKQANKSVLMISHKAKIVENCNKEIRLG